MLYTKMLKETETEETISFFVTFLSLVTLELGEPGPLGLPRLHLCSGPQFQTHYLIQA